MFGAVINDVFVDFVRDGKNVPFPAKIGDDLKLFAAEDLSSRVVRRINNDSFRLVIERRGKLLFVERPIGPSQLNIARRCAGDDRIRAVIFIERFEDDNFIPRINDGEKHVDHGFG